MIKIDNTKKAISISANGFAFCVSGNGGEEELVIAASGGQDFRTRLIAIAARIDGDLDVVQAKVKVADRDLPVSLTSILTRWCYEGERNIPPTADERAANDKRIAMIVTRFISHNNGEI